MPFSGDDRAAVLEGQLVGLLCIIHRTFRNHMARNAVFIEYCISDLQISHIGESLRSRDRCIQCKLLPIFLWNFDISCAELAGIILFDDAENIPDDLFLPRQQPERLSCPASFGMAEILDEPHSSVSLCRIVVRFRQHKACRFIILQFRIVGRSFSCLCRSRHQPPPRSSSISSTAAFFISAPAVIRLLAAGVRPNCSAILFMIFR